MSWMQLNARANLKAGGRQRRFLILAYTGGLLRVSGFSVPVVVDLSGLEAQAGIPIVLDHKTTTENTIGQTAEINNNGRQLTLAGPITGQSAQVRNVIAQADSGYNWQASIGCAVESQEEIASRQRVTVNGQTFSGPIIVARRSVLRETSVLPVGADASTQVNLAASAKQGTQTMTFEEWLPRNGFDVESLTPESTEFLRSIFDADETNGDETTEAAALVDIRAARAEDHERIAEVETVAAGHPRIAAAAIRNGWTATETENHVLRAQLQKHKPGSFGLRDEKPEVNRAAVLCASFAMTAGASPDFLAKSLGQKAVDAATDIKARGATLRTVMDSVLQAAGVSAPSNRITDSYIRAAFEASQKLEASGASTMSLPGILSNAANKLLLQGYEMVNSTWQHFCVEGNLADFKEASRYRMVAQGEFEEVGRGGKIKHLVLNKEDQYTNQAKTYAKMVGLNRQDIINDDLSAFETIPMSLGRLAIMQLEKQVYKLLLANAGSFFHANNSNLLTGGNSALDIDALTAAEQLFLTRTDGNGDPIMLLPELILCGPSLSVTANQLVRDTQVVAVGAGDSASVTPGGNPHSGRFSTLVTPWLENANIPGYSATKWFLLSRPQASSGLIEVGFLNGQKTPTIETADMDFSTLGMVLRGYWDFGVAFQDSRYGVQNDGQ